MYVYICKLCVCVQLCPTLCNPKDCSLPGSFVSGIFQFVVIHIVKSFGVVYELLIAKFRLKLKKVGKTTRPLRYDLNQIPYDYTVQMGNRFKGQI